MPFDFFERALLTPISTHFYYFNSWHHRLSPVSATALIVVGVGLVVAVVCGGQGFRSRNRRTWRWKFRGASSSSCSRLRGPKPQSLLIGSFGELTQLQVGVAYERWLEEHGETLCYKGPFGAELILSTDFKAISHVLARSEIYQKPPILQYVLGRSFGNGIALVEGEQHRKQRKIMTPAFGPAQIRVLTHVFVDKAIQLRDAWSTEVRNQSGRARVDVVPWMTKLTIDIIGVAGFNHDLDALNVSIEPTKLSEAVMVLLSAGATFDPFSILRGYVPILRSLPFALDRQIKAARKVVDAAAGRIIDSTRERLRQDKTHQAKDLVSLLVQQSLLEDEKNRISDAEILSQVPTFLTGGSDTTNSTACWALFALCCSPRVQAKLRAELIEAKSDRPSMDELNALPYLDAVVREALRLYPPIAGLPKYAMADDVIPLSAPIVDRNGQLLHEIVIRKGQSFTIPILPLNRKKSLWGEDSFQFRPERWESLPDQVKHMPGLWGNMMSFSSGPRSCVGLRFAITELKAFLFVLVRSFEFELAVPKEEVISAVALTIVKPTLKSSPDKQPQLPIYVRPILDL